MLSDIGKAVQGRADGTAFALRGARLPACTVASKALPVAGDGLVGADLILVNGRIEWIGPPGSRTDLPDGSDLDRAMIWPCPVDCHTHIDKGQVWPRSGNPDGSFASALAVARTDTERFQTAEDIRCRSGFQLKAAHAHGTAAIRTHVGGGDEMFDTAFEVLSELASDWSGQIALQLAPFSGIDDPFDLLEHMARRAAGTWSGVLSLFIYTSDRLDGFLDRVIGLAETLGLALDFHADENLEPESHCLRAVARAVLRNRFQGPVLVGHCCALSVQTREELSWTLDLVAEAGIGIVSLPQCNAYLMDRGDGRSPRRRGFAPVHEMRARGIPVAIGSDNVRDAFHAYGDLDMAEVFRDAVRLMQLDHPVGDWVSAVTGVPAGMMGLANAGRIVTGAPADLIIFPARNWSEYVARPLSDRLVLRGGRPIDSTPPPFAELDDLEGMTP